MSLYILYENILDRITIQLPLLLAVCCIKLLDGFNNKRFVYTYTLRIFIATYLIAWEGRRHADAYVACAYQLYILYS